MRTTIVVNPRAQGGRTGRVWPDYRQAINRHLGPAVVVMTQGPGHAEQVVRQFARQGAGRIVLLGGDGTLNEAVNGLFDEDGESFLGEQVELVPYPAGTGQDFSRSIGLLDASRAGSSYLFLGATSRKIDVGRLTLKGHGGIRKVRHFINIASLGMSADIVARVAQSNWRWGLKSVFFARTLQTLSHPARRTIVYQSSEGREQTLTVNTVAIANGQYFGRAMKIAPEALVDDGLLDVVILKDINLRKFLAYAPRLYRGTHIHLPEVLSLRTSQLSLWDTPGTEKQFGPTPIECDGELPGTLPATFCILPQKIAVWAPWHWQHAARTSPARASDCI